MKKFNLKHFTSLLFATFLLQGCMPDSLTKFTKSAPQKAAAASTTTTSPPVVDASGNPITFVPPTQFGFVNLANPTLSAVVGTPINPLNVILDGTLADPTLVLKFFDKCTLVTTGNTQTQTFPPGMVFNTTAGACAIFGTPTSITAVTTAFCSDPTILSQTICVATSFTWNSTTSTCSNPDYQYTTQAACVAGKNKWYPIGSAIPYRITMNYHNASGVPGTITTTVNIGAYKKPAGLALSQSDKIILNVASQGGTITDIAPVTTTTASTGAYARANIISGATSATGVAKIVDTVGFKIGMNKLVALYVNNTAPFTINGFIAVLGTCSNATYVTKASCLTAGGAWTDSGKIGKIFNIDTSFGILYVENISSTNKYFSTNDQISSDANGYVAASFITQADNTYVFNDTAIDNDAQYFVTKYNVQQVTSVYETGSAKFINPIVPLANNSLSTANGVTFKISPSLPAGLSFNTSTGMISGAFNADLSPTTFTITATNALGSASASITLASITAPGSFTLTNKQIITVTNTALFKEGEDLAQPITPPLTDSPRGKILKILNGYQLAIETYNGDFIAGASLDSGTTYKSEKASIIPDNSCVNTNYSTLASCTAASYVWSTGAIYYNSALRINTSGGYVSGSTITTTGVVAANTNGVGATGTVVFVNTESDARDTLYVQYFTQGATGVSSATTFYEGDTVNSGATIYQVVTGNMKLGLTAATGFLQGGDITSSNNAGAYTYGLNGSIISVSDITKQPAGTLFKVGDTVYNDEKQSIASNSTTISSSTLDNLVLFERGKNGFIHGYQSSGSGMTYSITPSLPIGLTFNSATGAISGNPTTRSARKDYLITGSNFIGSTFYVVSLEVRDYFQVADQSGVSSFLLHKVGDTQVNRKCRVNATDIINATPGKALDIRCFLDGEEEDLHFSKLKFNALVGAGICQYVVYAPFFFQQFNPIQSKGTTSKYTAMATVQTGCSTGGTIPTPDLCESNYTSVANPSFPNCDEGYLQYTEQVYVSSGSSCSLSSSSVKKVQCGGIKASCISGPVTNILTTAQLELGNRAMVYSASAGFGQSWTIDAPMDHGDLTNLRVANGTLANKCLTTNADVNTWSGAVAGPATGLKAVPVTTSPLGMLQPDGSYSGANPFYTFYCLDAANEVNARIRVSVRDWDRAFRIDSGIDNQSFSAPPALMNASGTDPITGLPYNNYADWDDSYSTSGAAATYTGGSCGVHAAGSCSNASYTNQYSCKLYGNTWTGDEEYKYPGKDM